MIAVIVDHTGHLYPKLFVLHSIFSVTMFVFLGGITSCMSLEKRKIPALHYIWKRIKPIIFSYAIATAVYRFQIDNYVFSVPNYMSSLLLFNASPPFYFLVFYLELIAISPLLYKVINKYDDAKLQILVIVGIALLAVLLSRCKIGINIRGGRPLLGGTYLYVFVIGIAIASKIINGKKSSMWIALLSGSVAFIMYECLGWIHKAWSNPPNTQAVLYTLIVATLLISLFNITNGFKGHITKVISSYIRMVGEYSIYIFLYHLLIIDCVNKCIDYFGEINNIEKGIALILCSTLIPIGIAKAYAALAKFTSLHWHLKMGDILRAGR